MIVNGRIDKIRGEANRPGYVMITPTNVPEEDVDDLTVSGYDLREVAQAFRENAVSKYGAGTEIIVQVGGKS